MRLRALRQRALLVVGVEFLGFFGRDQPDLHEVERADESVADPEAARARDGVAERNRPVVLEQKQSGGRVVRDLLEDVPGRLVRERADALRSRLGAGGRSCLDSLFSFDAEADQRPDLAAELDRLILGEVAQMLNLDLSVDVLVDRERVDHAHGVALAQPFELGDDLAVELGLAETQNNELNRSDWHVSPYD